MIFSPFRAVRLAVVALALALPALLSLLAGPAFRGGHDLDAETSPLEAGLGWVVSWDHDFVGKSALETQRGNVKKKLVAFTTEGRAIPREGYSVTTDTGEGTVCSGNFSPTLQHGIGMAYVSPPPAPDETMTIDIRKRSVPCTVVSLPFIDR